MFARALLVVLLVFGCGPQKTGDDASGGSSAGTTQGSTSADPTVGGGDLCPDDATRCTDFCLNLLAHGAGCSRADVTCFDWCTRGFRFIEEEGCGAEFRAVRACEAEVAQFDATFACEATECAPEYLALDACRGYCSYLGGTPYSGGSPEECDWGSQCYPGRDLQMLCPATAAPTCTCRVDGAEVGTCQLAVDLQPLDCNDSIHVLKGCCNDLFLPALEIDPPAPGDGCAPKEPAPGSPGAECPLKGMYRPCAGGVTFCDQFGGELVFGPCVAEPACELAGDELCDMRCELVEGVPTWVPQECMEGTT